MMRLQNRESGFVLILTFMMISALLALFAAYYTITNIELATTKFSKDSATGFFAAEGGLNIRAEEIRSVFVDYNRPTGSSPNSGNECSGGNDGSGDFACLSYQFGNYSALTYIEEDPSNPISLTIPPGERYQNLNAQEYRYTVNSIAKGVDSEIEAILQLRFKSRLVPLFQFVAFYDKDLEILPGPTMVLSGPIHTNGDLYLNAGNSLSIDGQVTTAGSLFRGRKNDSSCLSHPVRIKDPINYQSLYPSCASRTLVTASDIIPFNDMVEFGVDVVTVPEPEQLDPNSGSIYWASADLRLVLNLDGANNPDLTNSTTGVEVRNSNQTVNSTATNNLHACPGSVGGLPIGSTFTFYNNREGQTIRMLEVDMQALFDCAYNSQVLDSGKQLDDSSDGGLVIHLSVDGPDSSATSNNYGVRIRNAAKLQSTDNAAPQVAGLSIISDQALYTHGHYNNTNKIPAALLADTFNPLSTAWNLSDVRSTQSVNNRVAANTTINAAVLAGTDSTGGIEGAGGQGGAYNGGLENYPRMHENWSGRTLSYRGSFVSLTTPRHQDGAWVYGNPQYTAPGRDWDYDTDFNDAANLPPLTPRFVYLRQELFVREYEQ